MEKRPLPRGIAKYRSGRSDISESTEELLFQKLSDPGDSLLKIAYLADHPDIIPTLARWFQEGSPDYFAGWTPEDMEQHFQPWLHRDRLPLGLVAFEQGEVVGCIVLREKALEREPAHSPGLGGLHVAEPHRGRGIGSALVQAGMDAARALGYEAVYTGTDTAAGILERLGWEAMESVAYHGHQVVLYRYVLRQTTGE